MFLVMSEHLAGRLILPQRRRKRALKRSWRPCGGDEERGRESDDIRAHRDSDRDRDGPRVSDRDRQYTLTQRPSKQFNIELNKQVISDNLLVQLGISDKRKIGDFV